MTKVKCIMQQPTIGQIVKFAIYKTIMNAVGASIGISLIIYFAKLIREYFTNKHIFISMLIASGMYVSIRLAIAYIAREILLLADIISQNIVSAHIEEDDGRVYNTVNTIDFLTKKYNLKVNVEETEKLDNDELHNKNDKED